MNKKFDRALQWGKEKMGKDNKTTVSDDFKAMEMEMQMRNEGMDRLHSSAQIYIKSLSKRREGDDREKMIPVDIVAQSMLNHGEEFESDSQYGQCLITLGHANESIARVQETYVEKINETWLLSLERSLAQMKEYQTARKKLESRRLAYDATLSKMQKQKKEDFRLEEELRSQKIKYEESNEDVCRRMTDIAEAEAETLEDLSNFMEAELEYYEKCRNILLKARDSWPAELSSNRQNILRKTRSRSNTTHSINGHREREVETPPPMPVERPTIRSRVASANTSFSEYDSDRRSNSDQPLRPSFQRVNSSSAYEHTSNPHSRMLRTNTDILAPPSVSNQARMNLRPVTGNRPRVDTDVFADDYDTSNGQNNNYSPERHYSDQLSESPVNSSGTGRISSRVNSSSNLSTMSAQSQSGSARKPPPPPVSRIGKKAPPPPPPLKRAGLSSSNMQD